MKPYVMKALLVLGIIGVVFLGMKFMFNSSGKIPGETLTDAILAQDTIEGGISPNILIINEKADCTLSNITLKDIIDSKIVQQPSIFTSDGKTYGTWTENWTIRACGKLVHIPIKFVQVEDVPGTTYVVSTSDIVFEDS